MNIWLGDHPRKGFFHYTSAVEAGYAVELAIASHVLGHVYLDASGLEVAQQIEQARYAGRLTWFRGSLLSYNPHVWAVLRRAS